MSNIKAVIPLIKVTNINRALEYYQNTLHFTMEWIFTDEKDKSFSYISLSRDEIHLHISNFQDDGVCGSVINFAVEDVFELYDEFKERNVEITYHPRRSEYKKELHEMFVKDPDGNTLRFGNWFHLQH